MGLAVACSRGCQRSEIRLIFARGFPCLLPIGAAPPVHQPLAGPTPSTTPVQLIVGGALPALVPRVIENLLVLALLFSRLTGCRTLTNSDTRARKELSPSARIVSSLHERRLGHFLAELILIIAGILIALAVDGWISDFHDRQSEVVYLQLLARDIEGIQQQIHLQIEFEKQEVDAAARAYSALASPDPGSRHDEIQSALALLTVRRTLSLHSATYDQMVSSGHLQLIRNHDLRNRIVRYFAAMKRVERITDNNNRELIDNVFIPFMMRAGITGVTHSAGSQVIDVLKRGDAIMSERLGAGFRFPTDRVLTAPAEAESWDDIRRNVLFRMEIASTGQALAESTLDETQAITSAIGTELNGR